MLSQLLPPAEQISNQMRYNVIVQSTAEKKTHKTSVADRRKMRNSVVQYDCTKYKTQKWRK